ncbi:YdcF family protein [Kaarinaea lacus]
MSLGLKGVIELLIIPPGGIILLILLGLLLLKNSPRVGKGIIISGLLLLYICSLPATSQFLLKHLETPVAISSEDFIKPRAGAIVVLGSGRRENALDFDLNGPQGDTVSAYELERIRYAAWISRKTQLPILASGGQPDNDAPAESILMKKVLEEEFGVEVKWTDTESRNTFENAQYSSKILKQDGIKTIYLVTQALHMSRAQWSFEKQGMEVIPAPTGFMHVKKTGVAPVELLPSALALNKISLICHETLGNIWYRLQY